MLLRTQQNAVFVALATEGLDAAGFEWLVVDSTRTMELRVVARKADGPGRSKPIRGRRGVRVNKLVHQESGYYFLFDLQDGQHFCEYSPGPETMKTANYPGTWALQLSYVRRWASLLARELAAPNIWEEFQSASEASRLDLHLDAEPFTQEQVHALSVELEGVRRLVIESSGLQQDAQERIGRDIAYLKRELERQSRFNWKNLLFGVMMTWLLDAIIPPDAVAGIGRVIVERLGAALDAIRGLYGLP